MLRNYLLVALRNLRKHRLYSAITIGGLAVGLAACLMIILFVRDELSYDRWLPNAERIAGLEVTFRVPGREPIAFANTPGPVKAALEKAREQQIYFAPGTAFPSIDQVGSAVAIGRQFNWSNDNEPEFRNRCRDSPGCRERCEPPPA